MEKLRQCLSALFLGACIVAPLPGWAEEAPSTGKEDKSDKAQEQKAPRVKDRKAWEKSQLPNKHVAPPEADMPIIIQDQPVKTGIVKLI